LVGIEHGTEKSLETAKRFSRCHRHTEYKMLLHRERRIYRDKSETETRYYWSSSRENQITLTIVVGGCNATKIQSTTHSEKQVPKIKMNRLTKRPNSNQHPHSMQQIKQIPCCAPF